MKNNLIGVGLFFIIIFLLFGCSSLTKNVSSDYNLDKHKESGLVVFSFIFPGKYPDETVSIYKNLFGESIFKAKDYQINLYIFPSEEKLRKEGVFLGELGGTGGFAGKGDVVANVALSGDPWFQSLDELFIPGGRLVVINLPKGRYEIGRWVATHFQPGFGSSTTYYIFPPSVIVKEFDINPGKATYLGQISVNLASKERIKTSKEFYKRDIDLMIKKYQHIKKINVAEDNSNFKIKLIGINQNFSLEQCSKKTNFSKIGQSIYQLIRENRKHAIQSGGNVLYYSARKDPDSSRGVIINFDVYKCSEEYMNKFK